MKKKYSNALELEYSSAAKGGKTIKSSKRRTSIAMLQKAHNYQIAIKRTQV
jgi:hypothetical protein